MEYPNPIRSPLENPDDPRHMVVNIGPSHPTTHGTIQIIAEFEGETVRRAEVSRSTASGVTIPRIGWLTGATRVRPTGRARPGRAAP